MIPNREINKNFAAALDYLLRGWHVVPLCWPTPDGACACGNPRHKEGGKRGGKQPLTPNGVNDSSDQTRQVFEWWQKWPHANVGIDLGKSGLVGIGPDAESWHQTFQEWGLPPTLVAQSGGGAGHVHYYYQRPKDWPTSRSNRPGEYDIQSQGYFVAAPSLHPSGRTYQWLTPEWFNQRELPPAPDWVFPYLDKAKPDSESGPVGGGASQTIAPQNVYESAVWQGLMPGRKDRSLSLFYIGLLLAKKGFVAPDIAATLRERDISLGFHKYAGRSDQGTTAYWGIARTVTLPRPTDTPQAADNLASEWGDAEGIPFEDDDAAEPEPTTSSLPPAPAPPRPEDCSLYRRGGKWAREHGKPVSLTALYFKHLKEWQSYRENRQLRRQLPIENPTGPNRYLASHHSCGYCSWMFENPNLRPADRKEVAAWLAYADGEFAKGDDTKTNPKLQAYLDCLEAGYANCDDHGHRHGQVGYCGLKSDPECATSQARDMGRIALAPLPEGQQWRCVWLRMPIDISRSLTGRWDAPVNHVTKRIIKATGHKLQERLKRRKHCTSRIWHRSVGFHLDYPTSYIHVKLVFVEHIPGYLTPEIRQVAEELGAEIVWEMATADPFQVQMQLVGDCISTLYSVDPDNKLEANVRRELFSAYWNGTKGEKLMMPMNELAKLVAALDPPEREICDVEGCGLPLKWVRATPQNTTYTQGATVSSPSYIWQNTT